MKLRPAVAAIIGALASALIFALALAMVASRPASARAAAVPVSKTVTVRATATLLAATVTVTDPSGQTNTMIRGGRSDDSGQAVTDSTETKVELPAGGTVTVTVTPILDSGDNSVEAAFSCGIYLVGPDAVNGEQLTLHKSTGGASAAPTICTWTNR